MPIIPAPIQPDAIASLGTLVLKAGTYIIDTTGVTLAGPDVHFQGVLYNNLAAFAFDSITLDDGVLIQASGSYPLVLLSRGDVFITGNASIHVDANGTAAGAGAGTQGTPPGEWGLITGGAGGGYGGAGGANKFASPGGSAYGDISKLLQGGSPGSGSASFGGEIYGGGGGGCIELAAAGTIELSGTGGIFANGGPGTAGTPGGVAPDPIGFYPSAPGGGGGSGGGILLMANTVHLSSNLNATGGMGGPAAAGDSSSGTGSGGGGGRITVLYGNGGFNNAGNISVSGGGAGNAFPGETGVSLSQKQS